MLHLLITGIRLAVAVTIGRVAAWRRWAPAVGVAVAAGAALRLYIAVIAMRDSWQPPDFMYQFTDAVIAVFHHHDPLRLPNSEWHFLPAMSFVNAGMYRLGELTGLPWQVVGRVVPVGADIVLSVLGGALARGGLRRRMAAFQYALNPVPIMICAIHGQVEPVASALGVGAVLFAMRSHPRPRPSGVLLGLAIAVNSWPALLIPGVLHALTGWRARLTPLAWACPVPPAFPISGPPLIRHPPPFPPPNLPALLTPPGVLGS